LAIVKFPCARKKDRNTTVIPPDLGGPRRAKLTRANDGPFLFAMMEEELPITFSTCFSV
jgi:hypothetical protein